LQDLAPNLTTLTVPLFQRFQFLLGTHQPRTSTVTKLAPAEVVSRLKDLIGPVLS